MSINFDIKNCGIDESTGSHAVSAPTLQSVGFGYCLVCTCPVADRFVLIAPEVDVYLKTICEVVGIQALELEAILEQFDNLYYEIAFCETCRLSLEKLQEIQLQLASLQLQKSQLKQNLCDNLLGELKEEGTPTSQLRARLTNKSGSRNKSFEKEEVITGDIDYVSEENSFNRTDFWIDEHDQDLTPDVFDTHDLKPCRISLIRLEDTEEIESTKGFSRNEKRRQLRLKKLLQRQGSKFHDNDLRLNRKILNEREPKKRGQLERQRTPRNFKCTADPNCHRYCTSEDMLRFHVRRIHERRQGVYNCMLCEAEFERLKDLRNHETTTGHHAPGAEKQKIECKGCRLVFKSQTQYNRHLERRGGECKRWKSLPLNSFFDRSQRKSQRFICGECGRKYRSPHHLEIHIRASHTEGFAFLCEFCCKPYKAKQTLIAHQRKEHPGEILASQQNADETLERIKNLTCEICQITFTATSTKRKHDAKKHEKNFKFFCEVCGSGWVCETELKGHRVIHAEERNFPCSQCDLKFKRADRLKRHVRTKHENGAGKKFMCESCPKKFFDKTALRRHMALMHRTEEEASTRKFGCEICSYTCVIKEYLTIHKRTKKHLQKIAALGHTDQNTGLTSTLLSSDMPILPSTKDESAVDLNKIVKFKNDT